MLENRNTNIAIILSGLVLTAGQYFYNSPQMERQRAQQQQAELTKPAQPAPAPAASPSAQPQAGNAPSAAPAANANAPVADRDEAIGASPRVKVETPSVVGSIALKGARIDDLSLVKFRETVDPHSPPIVLYSPSGTAAPYYAEFGWVGAANTNVRLPDPTTLWQQENTGSLTPTNPVKLKYDN